MRLYNYLVMTTRHNRFSLFLIRVIEYFTLPQFRKKEYHILHHLKITLEFLLIAMFCFMSLKTIYLDGKLSFTNLEFWKAKHQVEYLEANARQTVYQQVSDSFYKSGGYLRYQVYKETGIQIPESMSDDHVAVAVMEAKRQNVPISILLHTIKHESGFDSSALNPSSGAWGYCQTLNATFNGFYKEMNLTGGKIARNNLIVGIARLKFGYTYWKTKRANEFDRWSLAVACYAIGDSLPRAINAIPDTVKPYVNYIMNGIKL